MAEVQKEAPLTITTSQFSEMMRTIVSEIRKPPVDPIKEVQKAREQAQKIAGLKEYWEKKLWKLVRCAHSRQDGSCIIGWARQSDGIERGYCPNCDNTFGPELKALEAMMSDDMKKICPSLDELFQQQRRRPRGLMEAVRVVA